MDELRHNFLNLKLTRDEQEIGVAWVLPIPELRRNARSSNPRDDSTMLDRRNSVQIHLQLRVTLATETSLCRVPLDLIDLSLERKILG